MSGIHHDLSNKKMLKCFNRRAVGICKVLSITKLANNFESLIDIYDRSGGPALIEIGRASSRSG